MRAQGFAFVLSVLLTTAAVHKPSSSDVNKANNPLTPAITVNSQDQRVSQFYDFAQGSKSVSLLSMLMLNGTRWHGLAPGDPNQQDCSAEMGDGA